MCLFCRSRADERSSEAVSQQHVTGRLPLVSTMPRLEELANVALRVPSILVLDLLYKCDIEGLTDHLKAKNEDMLFKYKYVIWNMYYLGKHAPVTDVFILSPALHSDCCS